MSETNEDNQLTGANDNLETSPANPGISQEQTSSETIEAKLETPEMALPNIDFVEAAPPLDLNPTRMSSEKFRIEPVRFNGLLNNEDPNLSMTIGKGFDLKIGTPIFITKVRIRFATSNSSRIEFSFKSPIRARKSLIEGTFDGDFYNFEINGFATSLSIDTKSSWFTVNESPSIHSIEVFGFEPDKFVLIENTVQEHLQGIAIRQDRLEKAESEVGEVRAALISSRNAQIEREEAFENDIVSRTQKITDDEAAALASAQERNVSISELNRQIESITTERNSLSQAKTELDAEVIALESKVHDLTQKEIALQNTCAERQEEIDEKVASTLKLSDKLKKLENDLAVTIDLNGYGKKTLFNIALYTLGIFVLFYFGWHLTNYALAETKEIWTAYTSNPKLLEMNVLVGLKLPFIILVGTALTTLYKLALALLRRIMQNEDRRTSLSEISILAGDLTDAAMHGSSVSEVERNQLKFAAKMWLVRDLLSNRISNSDDSLKDIGEPSPSMFGWVRNLPQLNKSPNQN